eukprot:TRINITY_DN4767_c0_g1_i4.p1 TRINITY_DN4767_c0_g1~~TRINITY_DN4767_c0_g1_i4.p1  ORF type:complete len:259 (-),score=64.62 TRINITY_DN4767_c0_g1_i4:113-889(-)
MSEVLLMDNITLDHPTSFSPQYPSFEAFLRVTPACNSQACPSWHPQNKATMAKHANCHDSFQNPKTSGAENNCADTANSQGDCQLASKEGSCGREEGQAGETQYPDLQCKKPRRVFKTREDKQRFVQTFLAKEKTELCKNWEAYHYCKFGDRCSFAHGIEELRSRTDMPPTYKLKQCKQFSETGTCSYGMRCQFIHNSLSAEKQREASYCRMLEDNCKYMAMRMNCLGGSEHVVYVSAYERRRLGVFCKLGEGAGVEQ